MSIEPIPVTAAAPPLRPGAKCRPFAVVEAVSALDCRTISEMYELYCSYYDATSSKLFEYDLSQKESALLLRDGAGAVVGFSTIAIQNAMLDTGPLRAIYSGDTIIDRAYWGTQALAFTWLRHAGSIKARAPDCPLYWFLIVKGHRTYRYLSAFSIDFYPHWAAPTPAWARRVIDRLACRQFDAAYDSTRGIVSFPQSRGHLKPPWAAVEPEDAARPDVAFFLRSNPGYIRGEELVCLTELTAANLRPLARRVFEQGLRE